MKGIYYQTFVHFHKRDGECNSSSNEKTHQLYIYMILWVTALLASGRIIAMYPILL